MAKGRLFEYAVIHHPKPAKKDEEAPASKLIVDVTRVLCTDEKAAAMRAARAIPTEYAEKLEEVDIAVRPF
jgi:hypothetical protein